MLTPAKDCEPAAWIVESIHGFAEDVGSVVPPVFPAYLRIFHPASVAEHPVTWQEIAKANGRTAHSQMQFHALVPERVTGDPGTFNYARSGSGVNPPREGSLDQDTVQQLLSVLREHTATPQRCWFAFWNGWGIPVPLTSRAGFLPRVVKRRRPQRKRSEARLSGRSAPTFSIPGRELLLFGGTIDDAGESYYEPYGPNHFQSAYFWWPEDREWCVTSEIDFMSTYIGAGEECAKAILETPGIEAMLASVDDGITAVGDTVNPNPLAD